MRIPIGSSFKGRKAMVAIASVATSLIAGAILLASCAQGLYEIGIKPCAPVYGNWCGENYPLTGNSPDAVDDWDSACEAHDKCYDDGTDKSECDHDFLKELRHISHSEMVPQAMRNADSWFTNDGFFQGFESMATSVWATNAACEGGDGKAAEFYCQVGMNQGCEMSPYGNGGYGPGMPCQCGGYWGQIVEQ